MNRQLQSSITIFLCLMFLTFFMIIAVTIDLTRLFIGRAQIERALNSAELSTQADYSERLKSQYGLLYIDKNSSTIRDNIIELMNSNLNSPPEVDGFNLYGYKINSADPEAVKINTNNPLKLSNPDVLKGQILEYTKYLTPLSIGLENDSGNFISGETSDRYHELTKESLQSLNFATLLDEQITLDKTITDLIEDNNLLDENIDYIHLVHNNYTWLSIDALNLESFLESIDLDSISDVEDVKAKLNEYKDFLEQTKNEIIECQELLAYKLTPSQISNSYNNIENSLTSLNQFLKDNKVYPYNSLSEFESKLNFYKNGIGRINSNISILNSDDYLSNNYNVIKKLQELINHIIDNIGKNNDAVKSDAVEYDNELDRYKERPIINQILELNDWNLQKYEITESESIEIYNQIINAIFDTGNEVMPNFYNNLLNYNSESGNVIYNDENFFNNNFNSFVYDPSVSWVDDWNKLGLFEGNFDLSINELIRILSSIQASKPDKTGDCSIIQDFFNIANFGNTVMLLTKDQIVETNPSISEFPDQFLIDYYAMKTFTSYTATKYNSKKNLEGNLLDIQNRNLNYELEYILYGVPYSKGFSENENLRYANLMLYGTRVAECASFMHTNEEARKTVNTVASVICTQMPEFKHRFTELKEAVALFWASAEAAIEMEVLRAGGSAYMLKMAGNYSDEGYFYLNLLDSTNGRLNFKDNGLRKIMEAVKTKPEIYTIPEPRANYDGHIMMLLSTLPNETKLQRILDIINFNQTNGAKNMDYLSNTYAGIDVQAKVSIEMMFLNWQLFRDANIGEQFSGGYTYDVKWFQMY